MGIFGKRKLAYDGPASPPLAFESAPPIAPMGQMPDIQTPQLPQKKQGFFGQGGFGRYLAGSLGDALARNAGMGTPFMDAMQQRQRAEYEDELYQRRSAQEWAKFVRQHDYERENPKPDQFERQLAAIGIMPGTPEYQEYMKKRVTNSIDPVHLINDPVKGAILVGGSYGYPESVQNDGYDELPPGFQLDGGAGPQTPRPFP